MRTAVCRAPSFLGSLFRNTSSNTSSLKSTLPESIFRQHQEQHNPSIIAPTDSMNYVPKNIALETLDSHKDKGTKKQKLNSGDCHIEEFPSP